MYNQGPFANWVPKPVMLLLILFFFAAATAINGVYTGNSADIVGAFGTHSEVVSFANNATTIGMGLSLLIFLRLKMRFRSKEIILTSALSMAILSYLIATSSNVHMLIIGSLLIGFFKMALMIEMILPLMFIIAPDGERGKFYAIFYPALLVITQLIAYYFADLVFDQNYQAPYFIMSLVMLIVAVCSVIFQHHLRFGFKMPLYQIDWVSFVFFGLSMLLFNYGFIFMRQQEWFNSQHITYSLLSGVLLLILVIFRQLSQKRKLFNFQLFAERENIIHSAILLVFLGIFMVGSGLSSLYTGNVLGYNNLTHTKLNLWLIPGIIISGIWAFYCFKNQWNLKYYIATGFLAYFFQFLMLYLIIQPHLNIEKLYIPMIFRGLGMGILFISIWFYASINLGMNDLFGILTLLMMVRNFLSTAFGTAFLGWAFYQGQLQSINDIGIYLDSSQYGMQVYGSTQINALLSSLKSLWGMLLWVTFPILFFVLTHHYGRFNYRRLVILRKRLKGNDTKGYRL